MNRFFKKSRRHLCFCILFLFLLSLHPAGVLAKSAAENSFRKARRDYRHLVHSRKKIRYRDQWERVIREFESVADRYPDSRRADDALYNAGVVTLKLRRRSRAIRDSDRALRIFRRLAENYPKSRYADDAQYFVGEIYRKIKKDPTRAYRAYAKIPAWFPKGDMVSKAKARLAELPRPAGFPRKGSGLSAPVSPAGKSKVAVKPPSPHRGPVHLVGVRHRIGKDYVRVVLDLDGPADFVQHHLTGPERVYLSLRNTRLAPGLNKNPIAVEDKNLKGIRVGQYNSKTARVVLDFTTPRKVSVFSLTSPDRVVLDIAAEGSVLTRLSKFKKETHNPVEGSPSLSEQFGMKIAKVIIDPGHGGKDPGCISRDGLKEKDITLDVGLRLKKLLEKKLGLQVVMTRDRDVYIPLKERTAIANRAKADLFISIHVNAARNRSISGVETWFLDLAASKRAKRIAARENFYASNRMSDLEKILNDLLLNNKTQESSRLAETLQGALVTDLSRDYRGVKNLGVKGAPFVVLVGAHMPSVLSEISFISNPTEEKRLRRGSYREQVAQGLFRGINRYVNSSEYAYSAEPE
ncbi:MAG: AMIN domain-containing protein [Deltaproteobacteria bacterium]|nr:AMIN domain-containing protein [Deltaproteobacteria bacterium]